MRKIVLFAVCFGLGAPALAQADADNPFMEMAKKFVEGKDFWQDKKFQHAYDAYFDCYEKYVNDHRPAGAAKVTDALFQNAYSTCAALREAGTKTADARVFEFHPQMAADERAKRVDQYRRNLAVLRLGDSLEKVGLAAAYSDYFDRTTEF